MAGGEKNYLPQNISKRFQMMSTYVFISFRSILRKICGQSEQSGSDFRAPGYPKKGVGEPGPCRRPRAKKIFAPKNLKMVPNDVHIYSLWRLESFQAEFANNLSHLSPISALRGIPNRK